ncbi:MAG: hypothetical protein ACFFD4_05915 [Candidatus Odinarchaeota archaeon]
MADKKLVLQCNRAFPVKAIAKTPRQRGTFSALQEEFAAICSQR